MYQIMEDVLHEYTKQKIIECIFVNNGTVDMVKAMICDENTDVVIQSYLIEHYDEVVDMIQKRDKIMQRINSMRRKIIVKCTNAMECTNAMQ